MKITGIKFKSGAGAITRNRQGLTLIETMVTMFVFSLVVIALIYTHMFGLMQDQLVESKLGADDEARKGSSQIIRDVRSAKIWTIGSGNASSYTPLADAALQVGTALQLNLTTATNSFIRYYFDSTDPNNVKLCRMHSPNGSASTIVASHLIAPLEFRAENPRGETVTDREYRNVLHFVFNFKQYQYPTTQVGTNCLYDFFKMEFRATPYAPE